MFIFGYGSLIWKVDFPYKKKQVGFIRGYARRMWQGSTDHRGIPENPGRVVTLLRRKDWEAHAAPQDVHAFDDIVHGVVFQIEEEQIEFVKNHLDFREKGGYSIDEVDVFVKDENGNECTIKSYVYIATTDNPNYLGPGPLPEIAKQIAFSKGPSGPNIDYLFNLLEALKTIAPDHNDAHLIELSAHVRKLIQAATDDKGENEG